VKSQHSEIWHLEIRTRDSREVWQPTGREWFFERRDAAKEYAPELHQKHGEFEYRLAKYRPVLE
jgi:hypothetical protein